MEPLRQHCAKLEATTVHAGEDQLITAVTSWSSDVLQGLLHSHPWPSAHHTSVRISPFRMLDTR